MSSHGPTDEEIMHKDNNILDILDQAVQDEVISAQDADDYLRVLRLAVIVHIDREGVRHGLWKDYPAKDQAAQIKFKIDRVIRTLERTPDGALEGHARLSILEEFPDIINYAVFGHRIVDGRVPE